MQNKSFIESLAVVDDTWQCALEMVERHLPIRYQLWSFFRASWSGNVMQKEFMKNLSFSKLNASSLLLATEMNLDKSEQDASKVEQALSFLGIRYSTLVLAINYCCSTLAKNSKNNNWNGIFQKVITLVEIGYRFGNRVPSLGSEGGALMGFACALPHMIFYAEDPKAIEKYSASKSAKAVSSFELDTFACEGHQIAAFVIQKLGFGTNTALGVSLALGEFSIKHLQIPADHDALRWKAALLWIESLFEGRNYPADPEMRSFFKEFLSTNDGQLKNSALETLYAELSKIRANGSNWKWHLPKS